MASGGARRLEMFFVQSFAVGQIAKITRQPLKQVKDTLARIQGRLREEMMEEELLMRKASGNGRAGALDDSASSGRETCPVSHFNPSST